MMTPGFCKYLLTVLATALLALPAASPVAAQKVDQQGKAKSAKSEKRPHRYSIEQAQSDRPQLHTIAFNGLAFLTGEFGASTFIPPGKVADYFGFQYMRDIDAAQKGHNPMFLNRVAGNVLNTLNREQKGWFLDLAKEQAPQLEDLALLRLPLIEAFHRAADSDLPEGTNGLDLAVVKAHVGNVFENDARLSLRRAEVMANIAQSLDEKQKAHFSAMKFGDFNSWPAVEEQSRRQMKSATRGQPKLVSVAYMTYASEFFSWYAGSETADTYFCPERHGTYFGGFYMKDIPAMGKRDYDISTELTGTSGEQFLALLTPEQRAHITAIIPRQRPLLEEIVSVRRKVSQELRKYLAGSQPDESRVLALGRRYGELDGEMSFLYASAFARVNQTLSDNQRAAMQRLRNLPGYTPAPYYIYSQAARRAPDLAPTDRFFSTQSEAPLR